MFHFFRKLVILSVVCHIPAGYSATQGNLDELMKQFESTNTVFQGGTEPTSKDKSATTEPGVNSSATHAWSYDGFMSFFTAYNFQKPEPQAGEADFTGFSRMRFRYFPELSVDLPSGWSMLASANFSYDAIFSYNDRHLYQQSYIDDEEIEAEIRELHLGGRVSSNMDIKVGRQILVWGNSDNIRVVDVLNPLDLREPGLTTLEDIRLPVFMIRGDYYFSDWGLNMVVIPEFMADRMPAYGSDYYAFPNPPLTEIEPSNSSDNYQYAVALRGHFYQWDLSLNLADVFEHQPRYIQTGSGTVAKYYRYTMLGLTSNLATGSWLIKTEIAYLNNLYKDAFPGANFDRIDLLLGVEYYGINDHTITVEAARREIPDYDPVNTELPGYPEKQQSQLVIQDRADFRHQTVSTLFNASLFDFNRDASAIYRAEVNYKPFDAWRLGMGIIIYRAGNNAFINGIADDDRLYFEVRHDY